MSKRPPELRQGGAVASEGGAMLSAARGKRAERRPRGVVARVEDVVGAHGTQLRQQRALARRRRGLPA